MGDGMSAWADDLAEEQGRQKRAKHEAWVRAMKWLMERDAAHALAPTVPIAPAAPLDEYARRALRDFMEMLMRDRNGEIYKLRAKADSISEELTNPFQGK